MKQDIQRKAKIFDVATLAAVSIKTVSRVLNNEPNVREATRERVLKAVKKLNYRPNLAARGLSAKRSYVIGLVYEDPHEFSYLKDVLSGALNACDQEDYALVLRPLSLPDSSLADDIRQFATQTNMDGVILPAPLGDFPAVIELLEEMGIPFVQIAPKKPIHGAISIDCNDEQASFSVTGLVISQGHTRIGFIKGHPDHGVSDKRFAGYRQALEENNIPFEQNLVRQGYFDFESGKTAARDVLKLSKPPTAIIASNDDMAAGVIFEAHEEGLNIPRDLSVVGFDDTPLASHIWPQLTTVRQPICDMSETATRLLIGRLKHGDSAVTPDPFTCEIIIRNSTAPR